MSKEEIKENMDQLLQNTEENAYRESIERTLQLVNIPDDFAPTFRAYMMQCFQEMKKAKTINVTTIDNIIVSNEDKNRVIHFLSRLPTFNEVFPYVAYALSE